MVKTTFFNCNKITLSGVEAPDVIPIVMGPSGRKFSLVPLQSHIETIQRQVFKEKGGVGEWKKI